MERFEEITALWIKWPPCIGSRRILPNSVDPLRTSPLWAMDMARHAHIYWWYLQWPKVKTFEKYFPISTVAYFDNHRRPPWNNIYPLVWIDTNFNWIVGNGFPCRCVQLSLRQSEPNTRNYTWASRDYLESDNTTDVFVHLKPLLPPRS